MKRKLLLLAAFVASALGMRAQTDVTSTYLTNADLEGDATSYAKPKSDRDIYQPTGWEISYTNRNENDLTSLSSSTTNWSTFSGKSQPTNGGEKAYWMRFRWGDSENITLSQETSGNLPAGTYCVSVDAYSDDNTGTLTLSAAGATQKVRANGAWANYKVVFTLASAQKVTVSLSYTNTAADDHAAAFDNVKILQLAEPTGITLKNELGGTVANISDFNVWYDDYTLEVAGTAGTKITVAADNISYTPEATGTVRFVKKDGIVYVFEGTTYKTAVHSSKADYVYTKALSDTDPITDNILENPSFETLGAKISDGKYKFGTPWTTSVKEASGGVRVHNQNAQHGSYTLCWRGTGNSYFSQEVTSAKIYKGYKIYVRQTAGGNGFGDFRFGLGNKAGDISYLSANIRLGSKSNTNYNNIHEAVLGASTEIPVSGAYFSCLTPTTARNSADDGSTADPVTQIDWIGLVGSDDFPITGVSSASYIYGTAYAPATAKATYLSAKSEAETTIADDTYTNVTGEERTNLQAAIDADVEDNDAAYNTATETIRNKQDLFTAALTHYQALIDAQAAVPNLLYASAAASAFKTAVATSASDAEAKLSAMTTNIRAYYESHALAEGVVGAVNVTSSIANPDAMDANNGWTWEGTKNDPKNNEPWTDSKGNSSHWYFDGGNWNASSWTTKMSQEIILPAGTYLLTAKGRAATNTTFTMEVGDKSVALPHVSSTGNVFNNGWGDASLEFTTDGRGIKILVTATTSTQYEWFSIADFRLMRLSLNESVYATATEYAALNSAISTAEANTLGFEDGQFAPYNNVDALTKLATAKAFDQTKDLTNFKTDVEAATTALSGATWTANVGDVVVIYNGTFAEANGYNPKGWTRSNGAWGQQITGLTTADHNVNVGTTTAWYYNTNGAWEYGKDDIYKMPLAASQAYKLTFKYRSHSSNSNNSMKASVLNGSSEGLAEVTFPKNGDATKFVTATAYFTTGAAGNYVLSLTQDGNTHLTDVCLEKVTSDIIPISETAGSSPITCDYAYANVTLTRTLKGGQWNGFSVPFGFTVAGSALDGAQVKKFSSVTGNEITLEDATEIVAGEPYLVKPTADVVNPTFNGVTVTAATDVVKGTGDYKFASHLYNTALATDGSVAYVSTTDSSIKKLTSGSIKGLRAIFNIPTGAEAKALVVDFGEGTTGILNVDAEGNIYEGQIYNLSGQRVNMIQKGIYIVNGKKVLIK